MTRPTLRITHPEIYSAAIVAYGAGVDQQRIVSDIFEQSGRTYSPITLSVWASEEGVAFGSSGWGESDQIAYEEEQTETSSPYKESKNEPELSHDERSEREIERQKKADSDAYHKARLSELTKSEARYRRLLDLIRETVAANPRRPMEMPSGAPSNRGNGEPRVCAFALSDIQAGLAVTEHEVGPQFAYNSTTLGKRFGKYEEQVWKFIDEQRLIGPVVSISFWGCGDFIENHKLHTGSALRTDLGNVTASITLANHLTDFLMRLCVRYPKTEITFDIVPGNHDRIGNKPGDDLTCENWAVVIGEMLKRTFEQTQYVSIYVHLTEFAVLQYGGARVLLHHGHGIQGTALLPWYGIDRKVTRWEGFHRMDLQERRYIVIGHFHNVAMWATNSGARVYVNGAFFSTTAFATGLGLAQEAQQLAFALTESDGIVYTKELPLLEHRHEPTAAQSRAWLGNQ